MKITIVGAGVIGLNLAKDLSEQNHDVCVAEKDPQIASRANEKIDARVIVGEGSDPSVLKEAGIESADLVIAVTASDETNMVVCGLANAFGAKKTIARIRNLSLAQTIARFGFQRFFIDEIINPEMVAAEKIVKIIQSPGTQDVADFAQGRILLRSCVVPKKSSLCGMRLSELQDEDFPWPFLVIAIQRDKRIIIPKGDTVIQESDRIYVLLPSRSLGEFLSFIDPDARRPEKVVLYGANDITEKIAQDLKGVVRDIILLEEDEKKAQEASGEIDKARVICGSPSDENILKECGVEVADVFVAASSVDHANLVSAVLAKKAGAQKTLIVTQQPEYLSVIDSLSIDVMINPRLLAVEQILRLLRGKNVSSVVKLEESSAEALELIPEQGSPITKAPLKDMRFPEHSIVGAVFRGKDVFLADGNMHIQPGENTIVFCQESSVLKIQKLFSQKKFF